MQIFSKFLSFSQVKQKISPYLALCKLRVVALMILTSLIGMILAAPVNNFIHSKIWKIIFWGNLGIALMACGAAAVNHLIDRHHDAKMHRTAHRPLPMQQLTVKQAYLFAFILSLLGEILLMSQINFLTALLTFLTFIGYAFVYTGYLKHATSQNIVIGGLSGAMPPLLGWTAVTGEMSVQAWLLVLIIFFWTPPHFWALAIYRYKDYARADIPMLPNTHGIAYTKLQIVIYTALLIASSILPFCIGMAGKSYLIIAVLLNSRFLYLALQLYCQDHQKIALKTFRFSILYLMLLFLGLLFDRFI